MSSDNSLKVEHVIALPDGVPAGFTGPYTGTLTKTSDSSNDIKIEIQDETLEAQGNNKPKRTMRLNRKKRYKTSFKGEAEATGVLSTYDVFGVFPNGQIGRMNIQSYLKGGAILWAHNGDQLPIGRANWIEWDGAEWTVGWTWAENEFAQQVRAEWDSGILAAMSKAVNITLDENFEVEEVVIREASVVPVGKDEGAVVASVDGPPQVLETLRAGLNVESLTESDGHSIIKLAASLRDGGLEEKINIPPADQEEPMPEKAQNAETEVKVEAKQEVVEPTPALEASKPKVQQEIEAATGVKLDTQNVKPWVESSKPEVPAQPKVDVGPPAKSEDRLMLEAAARDLVPEGFDVADSSDMAIKRAALSWDHDNVDKMPPIQVIEAFASLVQRRKAAEVGIIEASKPKESVKKERDVRTAGEDAMVAEARAKYLDYITNAHKGKRQEAN